MMKIFIATEYRITNVSGKYYVYSKLYNILKRYHDAFGKIVLCTRVMDGRSVDPKQKEITQFLDDVIPITLSSTLFYCNAKQIKEAIVKTDLVIGRFDAVISCRAASYAKQLNKPFFAEVMADAWDGYWNHGIIGKLLAPYMYWMTKRSLWSADYALYVTEEFLQSRYPCMNKSTNASNVSINKPDPEIFEARLKRIENSTLSKIKLVTTAAVNVEAKGQQFVIKAIPELMKRGVHIEYNLIGGGDQSRLRKLAKSLNIEESVCFHGEKSLEDVFRIIDECDIYIQPSLQEGLPRSVIEAMSRACPCLGARTAGIPELIDESCVFERKSVDSIVDSIASNCSKDVLKKLAEQNFLKAGDYSEDRLDERRNEYYNYVKRNIEI